MPTEDEIKVIAKVLAREEWPLATEQERSEWADAHWIKWARQAKSTIIAVRNLNK